MSEGRLGNWLEWQTTKTKLWRNLLYGVVGVLFVLGFKEVAHPHFGVDKFYVFWAGFGWVVAVVMIIVLKKMVYPILAKPEDFYGDDK